MQDGKLSTLFLWRNLDILDVFPRILDPNSGYIMILLE